MGNCCVAVAYPPPTTENFSLAPFDVFDPFHDSKLCLPSLAALDGSDVLAGHCIPMPESFSPSSRSNEQSSLKALQLQQCLMKPVQPVELGSRHIPESPTSADLPTMGVVAAESRGGRGSPSTIGDGAPTILPDTKYFVPWMSQSKQATPPSTPTRDRSRMELLDSSSPPIRRGAASDSQENSLQSHLFVSNERRPAAAPVIDSEIQYLRKDDRELRMINNVRAQCEGSGNGGGWAADDLLPSNIESHPRKRVLNPLAVKWGHSRHTRPAAPLQVLQEVSRTEQSSR
eukprot:NODE_1189_length_1654_cov_18.365732_g1055_i0.p1 GENE.NODE_1189_length_1654_cov_18.365732_g1055_i0~~NODE_1189_length_1654_cov_18.365732_g1055_i0.p1  ORF type:complete len:287 (+),score=48.55 NODE_1189_length_1654_cov_18.365732_g1055_i0:310-1170(+)